MLYPLLKWIHVLAAIIGLGSNITYGLWLNQPVRSPQIVIHVLKTIRIMDNRLANPAYGIILLTGLILVLVGRWSLGTPWILTALVLYFAVALFGMVLYGPAVRNQIHLAETTGLDTPEYKAAARRGNQYGIIAVVLVVAIVFLMVVKPALWA